MIIESEAVIFTRDDLAPPDDYFGNGRPCRIWREFFADYFRRGGEPVRVSTSTAQLYVEVEKIAAEFAAQPGPSCCYVCDNPQVAVSRAAMAALAWVRDRLTRERERVNPEIRLTVATALGDWKTDFAYAIGAANQQHLRRNLEETQKALDDARAAIRDITERVRQAVADTPVPAPSGS